MSISPLMPVYPRCGVRPVKGEHCHLIDEDGTRYLDFASGIAVNLLGHSHAGLIGAIQQQAETLMHVFTAARRARRWRSVWSTRPVPIRSSSPIPAPKRSRPRSRRHVPTTNMKMAMAIVPN